MFVIHKLQFGILETSFSLVFFFCLNFTVADLAIAMRLRIATSYPIPPLAFSLILLRVLCRRHTSCFLFYHDVSNLILCTRSPESAFSDIESYWCVYFGTSMFIRFHSIGCFLMCFLRARYISTPLDSSVLNFVWSITLLNQKPY